MIDRRLIANFDWLLLLLIIFVTAEGVALIYSATFSGGAFQANILYIRQIYWLLLGLLAIFVIISIDYRRIGNWAYFLYQIASSVIKDLQLIFEFEMESILAGRKVACQEEKG